jgi:hypothetical protein
MFIKYDKQLRKDGYKTYLSVVEGYKAQTTEIQQDTIKISASFQITLTKTYMRLENLRTSFKSLTFVA